MLIRYIYISSVCFLLLLASCNKYLDKKSDQNLSVPDNLEDIELLLNNVFELNKGIISTNTACDEYYLLSNDWEVADDFNKRAYIWDSEAQITADWRDQYSVVFIVNTALDNLKKIDSASDPAKWSELKGRALFIKGYTLSQLAQVYAPLYRGDNDSPYGLPVRVNSNFNVAVTRSTLKETYDQMIADLEYASQLLPNNALYKVRPTRKSCYAALAKIYLTMGNYQLAYDYSDACLNISDTLLDYNTLDAASEYPIGLYNDEIIYHTQTDGSINAYYWMARIDSTLYQSFAEGDLRKEIFFIDNGDGTHSFKGNYTQSYYLFTGIANDEMYLTRAEAAARLNNTTQALSDINALLEKRWRTADFVEISIADPDELLLFILQERKKELMFRGTRWNDLRRLNLEPDFQTTLQRIVNSTAYSLPPNDPRYTFQIPQETINLTGIEQNPK